MILKYLFCLPFKVPNIKYLPVPDRFKVYKKTKKSLPFDYVVRIYHREGCLFINIYNPQQTIIEYLFI